jgi:hypothetical protein
MRYFIFNLLVFATLSLYSRQVCVKGKVIDAESASPLAGVVVSLSGSAFNTLSGEDGRFSFRVNEDAGSWLSCTRFGYEPTVKKISLNKDTVFVTVAMKMKQFALPGVTVSANNDIDTVFGTWRFSVADFEFYEDKLLLLTYEKSLKNAKLILADASQKVLSSFVIPDEAKRFFKDYTGTVNVICDEHIYRIAIRENRLYLASLPVDAFNERILPCIDSLGKNIYFSDYSRDYPEFTYYAYNPSMDQVHSLKTVTDREQLKEYNMAYYFLKPKERLIARKLEAEYNVDKHKIAAVMAGATQNMLYTPLYAPLYIIHDTIMVFDHYNNAILKYTADNNRFDSIPVNYHHPAQWRDWKHKLFVDKGKGDVYALYEKNGFFCLKQVSLSTGAVIGSYTLYNRFVKNIKVKDGYVYYVFHPFESLQQAFVYREKISIK